VRARFGTLIALLAGSCAARTPAPASPAWSDDSRSDLAAQGTSIDVAHSARPPEAATPSTGASAPAPPPPPLPAAPLPAADDDAPLPPGSPTVRVLDLGAEPRTRLRYRLSGPATEDLTVTMTTGMATSLAGGPPGPEMVMPAVRMVMAVSSAPAGRSELTSTMRVTEADATAGPGVLPGLADRMRAELRKMIGMTLHSRLTTRGAVIKVESTLPPDAPASTQTTLEGLRDSLGRGAILPAEPVGLGARWETEADLRQNGMQIHQISRYRVRELAGPRVTLDLEVETSAGAQDVPVPGTPGGTAQLDSLRGSGMGSFNLDLGSIVPRVAHLSLDNHMSMRVQSMAMAMRMKMGIDMRAGR
jgi:hypothetical protein